MLKVVSDFPWDRPAKRRKGFALEGGRVVRVQGARFTTYRPLQEEPGLFRTFGNLSSDAECFLDFANRYGDLGGPPLLFTSKGWSYWYDTGKGLPSGVGAAWEADDLRTWQHHAERMRLAIRLWDALDAGSWNDLQEALGVKGEQPADELAHFALAALDSIVVNPLKALTPSWMDKVRGGWDAAAGRPVVRLLPTNLFQAMCLQLTFSMFGGSHFRACPACGRWFDVGPGAVEPSRSDKATCSDSCRMKLYKKRQLRARELRAAGWPLAKIARELGSDTATVKKWVTSSKE